VAIAASAINVFFMALPFWTFHTQNQGKCDLKSLQRLHIPLERSMNGLAASDDDSGRHQFGIT